MSNKILILTFWANKMELVFFCLLVYPYNFLHSKRNLTFLILQDQTSTKYLAHGIPLCILFPEPAASKEICVMCMMIT